jgi:hypothetical protein
MAKAMDDPDDLAVIDETIEALGGGGGCNLKAGIEGAVGRPL